MGKGHQSRMQKLLHKHENNVENLDKIDDIHDILTLERSLNNMRLETDPKSCFSLYYDMVSNQWVVGKIKVNKIGGGKD